MILLSLLLVKQYPQLNPKINHDLINVHKRLLANKLCLNLIKTEYLLIESKQRISKLTNNPVAQIDNRSVNRVTTKIVFRYCDRPIFIMGQLSGRNMQGSVVRYWSN